MTSLNTTDRFTRQADLIPQDKLAALTATVIGVGAIGRQLALQLAAIGVRKLILFDHDHVESINITTQGYRRKDIGLSKVSAVQQAIARIDPEIETAIVSDRFRSRYEASRVVFCCVDKIEARAAIWRMLGSQSDFWCDGRMLGESLRILTASTDVERCHYPSTLFAAHEANRGRCTARSTIYAAGICAGLMVHQFSRWLRTISLDCDLSLNLLASEIVVSSDASNERNSIVPFASVSNVNR